jgi:hypothetical protein
MHDRTLRCAERAARPGSTDLCRPWRSFRPRTAVDGWRADERGSFHARQERTDEAVRALPGLRDYAR